uniref:Uncharacterized protein n=1 Tax=Arundo donax TaxID=35708 RepID=A0A0A9F4H0_ARUDO
MITRSRCGTTRLAAASSRSMATSTTFAPCSSTMSIHGLSVPVTTRQSGSGIGSHVPVWRC